MKTHSHNSPIKDLRGYLKPQEIQTLLQTAQNTGQKPDQNYLLIRTLASTGRRISEILPLKPTDIDWENQQIQWNILKKKKPYKSLKPIDQQTLADLSRKADAMEGSKAQRDKHHLESTDLIKQLVQSSMRIEENVIGKEGAQAFKDVPSADEKASEERKKIQDTVDRIEKKIDG